ncbi:HAMP domain-containing sensor histidine kinase [uncultured Desulfobacter sp.]|uniref:HAMP domain-containing sensor histidine kinase n=1 Tax=uncultured Desulfobacter sp. TaxID=240139 RepID=UPI002AAC3B36|nr:HAMP domain-containing sensor histidine kinase [uncultured Desulfobacter sp.]
MSFSLRQKISFLFLVFMVVNSIIWFINHYSNSTVLNTLVLIEKKRDLLDTILEARRYEKNFFLRKDVKDLSLALSYINKIDEKQASIEKVFPDLVAKEPSVQQRRKSINAYRTNLETLLNLYKNGAVSSEQSFQIQNTVTQLGRELTTDIEQVVKTEKRKVFELLDRSREYLMISLFLLFILTVLATIFLVIKFNRPLKAIETGIKHIAKGDYDKIPEINTGDEFESLAVSLNDMIEELDRRKTQLIQAEKMSSLGTLTSGVAHELNNPLNNISTSIQIIQEEIEDSDIEYKRMLLDNVEQEIHRSKEIIRALLDFSRHSDFSIEPILFKKLVNKTMHLISGDIPSEIEVEISVPDDLEGRMDPRRIQQVLLNLIINAVYAMEDQQGGHLTISAYKDSQARTFVFTVKDTGEGIKEEHLARIFDPFFTTREVGKGSGLGLSIIHGIIEQHGGTISVNSSLGQGTIFTVSLPD